MESTFHVASAHTPTHQSSQPLTLTVTAHSPIITKRDNTNHARLRFTTSVSSVASAPASTNACIARQRPCAINVQQASQAHTPASKRSGTALFQPSTERRSPRADTAASTCQVAFSLTSVSMHHPTNLRTKSNFHNIMGRATLPDKTMASQVLMFRQLLHTVCRRGLRLSRGYEATVAQMTVLLLPVSSFSALPWLSSGGKEELNNPKKW